MTERTRSHQCERVSARKGLSAAKAAAAAAARTEAGLLGSLDGPPGRGGGEGLLGEEGEMLLVGDERDLVIREREGEESRLTANTTIIQEGISTEFYLSNDTTTTLHTGETRGYGFSKKMSLSRGRVHLAMRSLLHDSNHTPREGPRRSCQTHHQ